MLFDEPINQFNKSIWLCEQLAKLGFVNGEAEIQAALEEKIGPLTYKVSRPIGTERPAIFIGQNPLFGLCLVGGAANASNAIALWEGYGGSLFSSERHPRNAWVDDGALWLQDLVQKPGATKPLNWLFAGHSGGGAILLQMATLPDLLPAQPPNQTITFGSPRPFEVDSGHIIRNRQIVRWMTEDDWVCILPPRVEINPRFPIGPITRVQRRYQNFVHPHGGIEIKLDGTTSSRATPENATIPSVAALAAEIIRSLGTNIPFVHHSLWDYRNWLVGARVASAANRVRGSTRDEPPNPLSANQVRRAIDAQASAIFHTGAVQQIPHLVIPRARYFRAVRAGRIWNVYFGDQLVVCAPARRRAQGIAESGNNFLRRLQRQAVVAPDVLAAQFTAYLEAASDPLSDIKPTLNIKYPTS